MGTQTNGFSQASPVFIELNEGFRRQGGGRKALLPSADMTGGLEIWAEAPTVLTPRPGHCLWRKEGGAAIPAIKAPMC